MFLLCQVLTQKMSYALYNNQMEHLADDQSDQELSQNYQMLAPCVVMTISIYIVLYCK